MTFSVLFADWLSHMYKDENLYFKKVLFLFKICFWVECVTHHITLSKKDRKMARDKIIDSVSVRAIVLNVVCCTHPF